MIDHKNKITYTGKELYDYAFQNGYMLDGKGTKLEKGVMSELTDVNGKPAKIRLSENGISVFIRKNHWLYLTLSMVRNYRRNKRMIY